MNIQSIFLSLIQYTHTHTHAQLKAKQALALYTELKLGDHFGSPFRFSGCILSFSIPFWHSFHIFLSVSVPFLGY